jgi:hypothetical protein
MFTVPAPINLEFETSEKDRTARPSHRSNSFIVADAPALAKAFAAVRPMPEPVPVTSATFLSKDKFIEIPVFHPARSGLICGIVRR